MKLGYLAALSILILVSIVPAASGAALDDAKAGIEAVKTGKFGEAIELFTKAITSGELKSQALALVYNNRAHAYNELKQHKKAIADATEAIKLDSKYANAYNTLGNAYRRQRKYREAINYYSQAILLEPTADFFANRCLARGQNDQVDLAIQDCDRALELDGKHERAKAILVILRQRQS